MILNNTTWLILQVSKVREDKSVSQSVKGGQCNYGYEAAEPYKRK